jgi:N-hydroxyarylamine O-acetyltransferase
LADTADTIDIDAYLERIGYSGSRAPSLETLRALHAHHPAAISFENLDVLLKRRIQLRPEALEQKIVREGRGGYCFEQNTLFLLALKALGYDAAGLSARVYVRQAPGRIRRSHMLLLVKLKEGPYVADVGFGLWASSGPLKLHESGEQQTPHGPFRIVRTGDEFEEQAVVDNEWTTLYRFILEEQFMADYEVANWYCSTHPDSGFLRDLMVARVPAGKRLGLLNNRLSIHYPDGTVERRELKSAEEIAGALEQDFAIKLPEPRGDLLAALARLVPAA